MTGMKFGPRGFLAISFAAAIVIVTILAVRQHETSSNNPESILARADDLSWENDWVAAAPLYARAERLFTNERRPSEALYARASQMIPRAESEPISSLLFELQRDLAMPAAEAPKTRLRILTIQGMIETNYDAGMARQTWTQVESLAGRQGHYLLAMRAIGEQGIAAFLLGDFSVAKKLVLRAWIAAKYLHDPAAHVRYASVYGAGLVELQRYDEAIHVLDEAINTAAASPGVAYPSIAIDSKIDALRGLRRYDEALTLADEATKRLPAPNLNAHLFQIMTEKGQVYAALGQWSKAATEYAVALDYARNLRSWRGITLTGGLLAQAYEHENQFEAALKAIDEAITANEQLPQELYFTPRNLAIKAEILAKMKKVKESHALYEKSTALIDSLLATAPTPNVERELLTQLKDVYSGYFESLCHEGDIGGAFQAIEKARGRIEAQALEHHPLVVPHDPSPAEIKIVQLNLKLIEADNPQVREGIKQALYDTELQLDDPSFAGRTARQPMALRQVQEHLGPTELVLEYVLGEPSSHVLAITTNSVRTYDLPPEHEILPLVTQYRKAIHNRGTDPKAAQLLFNQLLSPVAEYRHETSIILVPDGELHLLPFSALMDKGAYALSDHTFSVSPSATVMCLLRDRESTTLSDPLQYVGVAAWISSSTERNFLSRTAYESAKTQFLPLPQSKEEVETIAKDFPLSSTVLLGADATETRFKRLPLAQYRVLHLALHGYADLEYPDRSALVFAPEQNRADDGLLEVREIRKLQLNASLVTLSACNTGVGPVGESDVANLVNAFIEAGAESVVSTLWELDDRTTEQLMTTFYHGLASGQSKASALNDAQRGLLHAGFAPYYWASFEMAGDSSGAL
jgi:CHAT domain-containing protein